jgi:hypothetical protein
VLTVITLAQNNNWAANLHETVPSSQLNLQEQATAYIPAFSKHGEISIYPDSSDTNDRHKLIIIKTILTAD